MPEKIIKNGKSQFYFQKWVFCRRKVPKDGYLFQSKPPLKVGTGSEASAAHPRPNKIRVPRLAPFTGPIFHTYCIACRPRCGHITWVRRRFYSRNFIFLRTVACLFLSYSIFNVSSMCTSNYEIKHAAVCVKL